MKRGWKRTLIKYIIFGAAYIAISIVVDYLLYAFSEDTWVVVLGSNLQFLNISALLLYNARTIDADYKPPRWVSGFFRFIPGKTPKRQLRTAALFLISLVVLGTAVFILA